MHVRTQFAGNAFVRVFNWLYAFFIPNLFFLLVNVGLVITLKIMPLTLQNALPYLLALLPLGPALWVLAQCADDFLYQHELPRWWRLFGTYWRAVKKIGGIWAAFLAIMYVAIVDGVVLVRWPAGKWLLPLMIIVGLAAAITAFNYLTFAYHNPTVRLGVLLRAAAVLTGRRWFIGVLNVAMFGVFCLLLAAKPAIGFMVAPIIFAELVVMNNHQAFRSLG